MFDAGRLSSKYPHFSFSVMRGMRTEQPRLATPHENLVIGAVSCAPVRRRLLSSPPEMSYALMCSSCLPGAPRRVMYFSIAEKPPSARVSVVETLVWQPAPF